MPPVTRFTEEGVPLEAAKVAVLPVPYDLSLSFRPGARLGPKALVDASEELELYDEELGIHPCDAGIGVADAVPWRAGDAAASHALVERACAEQLERGRFVVAVGGDHSVVVPLYRAHRARFGDGVGVLQVDAHTDLYESWQGSNLSHASPMHRLVEDGARLTQVGLRAISRESREYQRLNAIPSFPAHVMHRRFPVDEIVASLPPRVYVTFDFDALDPSVMPSVGTPLPDGLSYRQAVDVLAAVFREREVVGVDLVELSPNGHFHAEMTAAQLAYRVIGLKALQAGWVQPDAWLARERPTG